MKNTKAASQISQPTCDCGSRLPYGEAHTPTRYAHNITPEHRLAVLKQTGAPAHLIAKAEAQVHA